MPAPAPDATTPDRPIGLPPPRHGPARRLVWWLIVLSLPLVVGALGLSIYRLRALQRLDRALAFAARTDPGWDAPSAFRSGPPPARPEDDLAPRLRSVALALGPNWDAAQLPGGNAPLRRRNDLLAALKGRDHRTPLPAGLAALVLADLDAVRPAVEEARGLAVGGTGFNVPPPPLPRFPSPFWPRRGLMSQAQLDMIQIESLLRSDAAAQAEAGDPDLALADLAALLRLSSYDTVYPDSGWAQSHFRVQGSRLDLLGRVLTQSAPTEGGLARVAAALEGLRSENVLLAALRADRAGYDRALAGLAGGTLTLTQALGAGSPLSGYPIPRAVVESNRAYQLEIFNSAVELARLPVRDRVRGFPVWVMGWGGGLSPTDFLSTRSTGMIYSLFEAGPRIEVQLDAARVAVAAERFRLAHGRPPANAEELVPRFLPEAPADPFTDDAPMRLQSTADGLAAYSLGRDRTDGGGRVLRRSSNGIMQEEGADWGYVVPSPDRRGLAEGATPLPRDVFAREPGP
jgi:hypothetical protein